MACLLRKKKHIFPTFSGLFHLQDKEKMADQQNLRETQRRVAALVEQFSP